MFQAASLPRLRRRGFTLIELLFAMALLIAGISVLTGAFTASAQAFRDLKAIGDMQEELREDITRLRTDIEAAEDRAWVVLTTSLRAGAVDPRQIDALRQEYEAIREQADELDAKLRAVYERAETRKERAIVERSIRALERLTLTLATLTDALEELD
jgi:prepilin-type N-terminal cleavage/methylation domain-containing protein